MSEILTSYSGRSHHVEFHSKLSKINLYFYFQPPLSTKQFIEKGPLFSGINGEEL